MIKIVQMSRGARAAALLAAAAACSISVDLRAQELMGGDSLICRGAPTSQCWRARQPVDLSPTQPFAIGDTLFDEPVHLCTAGASGLECARWHPRLTIPFDTATSLGPRSRFTVHLNVVCGLDGRIGCIEMIVDDPSPTRAFPVPLLSDARDSARNPPQAWLGPAAPSDGEALGLCFLTSRGSLVCGGRDGAGRGRYSRIPTPEGARDVVSGRAHLCVRTAAGHVHCVGDNELNQLGAGPGRRHRRFVRVPVASAAQIVSGADFTCARTSDGRASCWGYMGCPPTNDFCTSAPGTDCHARDSSQVRRPFDVALPAAATTIAANQANACALLPTEGGGEPVVMCWGCGVAHGPVALPEE